MTIPPGTSTVGPQQATLTVGTRKGGAAAKAGHDLLIEVTAWRAELQAGEDPAAIEIRLTADSTPLEVLQRLRNQAVLDAVRSAQGPRRGADRSRRASARTLTAWRSRSRN
jgi:hypothetical protein